MFRSFEIRSVLFLSTNFFYRNEEILLTSLLIDSFELMNIWIGYNDRVLRGSYQWSDKARTTYTNWFNGQPDDTTRRGSCVKAALNQGYRSFLSWTDDDCSTLNSFICKKLKRNHMSYVTGIF